MEVAILSRKHDNFFLSTVWMLDLAVFTGGNSRGFGSLHCCLHSVGRSKEEESELELNFGKVLRYPRILAWRVLEKETPFGKGFATFSKPEVKWLTFHL